MSNVSLKNTKAELFNEVLTLKGMLETISISHSKELEKLKKEIEHKDYEINQSKDSIKYRNSTINSLREDIKILNAHADIYKPIIAKYKKSSISLTIGIAIAIMITLVAVFV